MAVTVKSKRSPVGIERADVLEELLDLVHAVALHGEVVARLEVVELRHLLVDGHLHRHRRVGQRPVHDDRPPEGGVHAPVCPSRTG